MATLADQINSLREALGEVIPSDGSESDTLFSNADLTNIIQAFEGNLAACYVKGWETKAAIYANFVDINDGNASRSMSDLHDNALKMVSYYKGLLDSSVGVGRTRIGRIRRPL